MLRSLYSGISGLRAHQQMMEITGNNIANVNTAGFKGSQATFQDTLSQLVKTAGAPQGTSGGVNPAQIGLGVKMASISTNFSQGSAQATGRSTDLMIHGDGFFVVKSGGESLYTRAGNFSFDANGSLTNPNGQIVQGWAAVDGEVNPSGFPTNIALPLGGTIAPTATENLTFSGNLSNEAAIGDIKEITTTVYDSSGATSPMLMSLEKTAADTWTMTLPDGDTTAITFAADGTTSGTVTAGLAPNTYTFDVAGVTQYSGLSEAKVTNRDGYAPGALSSFTVSQTGQVIGVFTNGLKQTLAQLAVVNFNNVNGLEKAGDSMFRTTVNSGIAQVGTAGSGGLGVMGSGMVEMSNVDLAQEFTNLVIAQRGFQANSRVVTTSDEILQELVNLKR